MTTFSPSAHRRALKRKVAGIRGKLTVVKREIAEIQAQAQSIPCSWQSEVVMRRIAIGTIAIVLLAGVQCEPQETKVGPLTRLRQTSIVVETLGADAKTLGLSVKSLESQMLVGLRRDIPRLAVRESARPFLYLQVTVSGETTVVGRERIFAACVSLQMKRPVTILEDVGVGEVTFEYATVWDEGKLLGGPRSSIRQRVKDIINDLLTAFAADYYRQNPQ